MAHPRSKSRTNLMNANWVAAIPIQGQKTSRASTPRDQSKQTTSTGERRGCTSGTARLALASLTALMLGLHPGAASTTSGQFQVGITIGGRAMRSAPTVALKVLHY